MAAEAQQQTMCSPSPDGRSDGDHAESVDAAGDADGRYGRACCCTFAIAVVPCWTRLASRAFSGAHYAIS